MSAICRPLSEAPSVGELLNHYENWREKSARMWDSAHMDFAQAKVRAYGTARKRNTAP